MAEYTLELPFGHFKQVLGYLNERREACDEILCDVRLTVGSSSVFAHRCVLAACSAYFQGMFSGAFAESSGSGSDCGMMEIDLSGAVSQLAHLQTLVSSLYTGCLFLSSDNITGITQLACFLLVDSVQALCQRYLHDTFSISTCVRYLKLADSFGLHDLWDQASAMVCSRFHDHFAYCQEMWSVSEACLLRLGACVFQHVTCPAVVLQFLIHWMENTGEAGDGISVCEPEDTRKRRFEVTTKVLHNYLDNVENIHSVAAKCKDISWVSVVQGPSSVTHHLMTAVQDYCMHRENTHLFHSDAVSVGHEHQSSSASTNTEYGSLQKSSENISTTVKSLDIDSKTSSVDNADPTPVDSISLRAPSAQLSRGSSGANWVNDENTENLLHSVLVAFVPGKETVARVTAIECEANQSPQVSVEFAICVYRIHTRQWLCVGRAVFPDTLEEKFSWRVACLHPKAYFLSLRRQAMHVLDLTNLQWSKIDCTSACQALSCEIRSLTPVAVNGKLYVLASDKMKKRDDGTLYETQQRYLCLQTDGTWETIADVHHCHMATPLSLLSVSDKKVYVVKANITLPSYINQKSLLLIREGHIFDSQTGEVTKFEGKTFAPSPMRVLVREGRLVIVDGEGWCRQLNSDGQDWTSRSLDLSDIRWCRAASEESYYPCLTNNSTAMGPSVWEFSGFHDHNSALLEIRLEADGNVVTDNHPPPPFRYITALTAGQLPEKFLNTLSPCHYVHA